MNSEEAHGGDDAGDGRLSTLEEIEESIPESRKKLSFGGPGETVIDVMEEAERGREEASPP